MSGRRLSPVPGKFTRAQLEADLGVSANELDRLEKQGIVTASERRQPGDTRPVLFNATDVALARFARAAHQFGMRGEQLREITHRLATKRRKLLPGWAGWVCVDGDGDVELIGPGLSLDELLAEDPRSLLAVRVTVPTIAEAEEDEAALRATGL